MFTKHNTHTRISAFTTCVSTCNLFRGFSTSVLFTFFDIPPWIWPAFSTLTLPSIYETEIMDMDIQKDCAEGYTAIGWLAKTWVVSSPAMQLPSVTGHLNNARMHCLTNMQWPVALRVNRENGVCNYPGNLVRSSICCRPSLNTAQMNCVLLCQQHWC
jgi:hypothetical protein